MHSYNNTVRNFTPFGLQGVKLQIFKWSMTRGISRKEVLTSFHPNMLKNLERALIAFSYLKLFLFMFTHQYMANSTEEDQQL
jgi:hypothetical protein